MNTPKTTHWVNLTNGLQAIRDYQLTDWRALRIQSTHCEQKRWEDVLASVPDEMLLRLAMGEECRIYDYGANKPISRACWQGLEWVRYVLCRRWLGKRIQPRGRSSLMSGYFEEQYKLALSDRALRRLDYFANMAKPSRYPFITVVCAQTDKDGDSGYFMNCLQEGEA
jgi:hypothetical protein